LATLDIVTKNLKMYNMTYYLSSSYYAVDKQWQKFVRECT